MKHYRNNMKAFSPSPYLGNISQKALNSYHEDQYTRENTPLNSTTLGNPQSSSSRLLWCKVSKKVVIICLLYTRYRNFLSLLASKVQKKWEIFENFTLILGTLASNSPDF
jgi:hypothetical protein